MEPSDVPVYYKGDDGIYRPLVDIRQVPSTSSGIYKTMLWDGNSAIFQQLPSTGSKSSSSLATNMPRQQKNTNNFEGSGFNQAEKSQDILQMPSTSSGIYRPLYRISPKQQSHLINLGCRDDAGSPESTVDFQELPSTSSGIYNSVDRISPRNQSEESNFNVIQGEKPCIIENVFSLANSELYKPVPAIVTRDISKKVLAEKTIGSHLQLPTNSGKLLPVVVDIPKQINPNNLEVYQCTIEQRASIVDVNPSPKNLSQSEIDIDGNKISKSSGIVLSNQQVLGKNLPPEISTRHMKEGIQNVAAITSLPSKTSKTCMKNKKYGILEISKSEGDLFKSVFTSKQSDSSSSAKTLIKTKQAKKTNDNKTVKGKNNGNMVADVQILTSTTSKTDILMENKNLKQETKNPKQKTKLNAGKELVNNMVDSQQQTSPTPESYRPLIWDMQKSFCTLESLLPNNSKTVSFYTGSANQNKNVALIVEQPSMSAGIYKRVNHSSKTHMHHATLLPKTKQTGSSDIQYLYARTPEIQKRGLWNLPNSLLIPDLTMLRKYPEKSIGGSTKEIDDFELDCSVEDILPGVSSEKTEALYFHIMGKNSKPDNIRDMTLLTLRTLLCNIDQKLLIKLIKNNEFVNFNRMVLWGTNGKRPLEDLFSAIKPDNYSVDEAKLHLLKYVKGLYFKTEKEMRDSEANSFECQACRKSMSGIPELVDHLNRITSEVTYVCKHCGYLRFTNICTFVYHMLADNYMNPSLEYCLVCGLYCDSYPNHLIDCDNFLKNIKINCNLCDFVSFSICSFKLHLAYHIKELPYICPECGEYYPHKEQLEEHMENVCFINYKFKYYFCTSESCGMIFSYLENFYSHISTEHYERRVICSICHTMFSAQREFLAHRTKEHPDVVCSYSVYNFCTLCPNYTFRAMSQQKHLTSHGCENKCLTMVYKCYCGFQSRFKAKFIEHKKTASCPPKTFHRPQIMKICRNCFDVQSFNYMIPLFVCEECQQILQPSLSLMNYYCALCHLVLDYSWSSVLDHFFVFHKRVDLLSLALHTMLIVSKQKVVPGRYLSQKAIKEVNVQFFNNVVKHISGSKNTAAITLPAKPKKSAAPSVIDLTQSVGRIRVRSPSSINASLSSIKHDLPPSNISQDNSVIMQPFPTKKLIQPKSNVCTNINFSMPTNTKGSRNDRQDIFFCRKCNFTSCIQSEMSRHCQTHCPSEYKCSECDRIFKTSTGRNNHLSRDHGLRLLAENQNRMKSIQHGEVQKILKQQIQGKLSANHPGKRSGNSKKTEGKKVNDVLMQIDISED